MKSYTLDEKLEIQAKMKRQFNVLLLASKSKKLSKQERKFAKQEARELMNQMFLLINAPERYE
jgi:hypothetical protein